MKTLLLALILAPVGAFAADDLANRPDLFGALPTVWTSSNVTTTGVLKTTTGSLHCINVSSAPLNAWTVYDSSDASTVPYVIARFPGAATVNNYCFNAKLNEGLTVVLPESGSVGVNVTYR